LEGQPIADYEKGSPELFPGLAPIYAPGTGPLRAAVSRLWIGDGRVMPPHHASCFQVSEPPRGGPVLSRLSRRGFWVGSRQERIVEELSTFTFYAIPSDLRLIDLRISLRASVGPVRFRLDGGAGLLHLALDSALVASPGFTLLSSVGARGRHEVAECPAAWCLAAGQGGVGLFAHPANPTGPGCWRLDAEGVLSADPFAMLDRCHHLLPQPTLTLATGEVVTFQYRLYLTAAKPPHGEVRQRYLDYAFPPHVEAFSGEETG
jgi:hypothetical protein